MHIGMATRLFAAALLLHGTVLGAPPQHKPAKMLRTINTDVYEIGLRKSGEADVTLISRDPVFINAYPMVWLEGEAGPKALETNGRMAGRDAVNNRLGQGHGILLQKGACDWMLQAYPTKPYFSVQVAFVNTGKKSVKIKMLVPWAVGGPKSGALSLGASTDQAVILENGRPFPTNDDMPAKVVGNSLSNWNVAVYNADTQRSLIAGFITNARAYTRIRLERSEKAESAYFDLFRGECVYDPPIEVQPGERLESEVLYLSVGESSPFEGLERYGAAFAAFNQLKHRGAFLPHGWDSWNTKYKTDINEERMLAALDFVDRNLKRYGWEHFSMDSGWELGKGNWEPDAVKFPHGMKWFADQIHSRGMTAGIWIDPFTVDTRSPLAQAHPDWLRAASSEARGILGENDRILDVTAPGAYEYVRDLIGRIGNDWGYDALQECDFVYRLLFAESYANPNLTRIDVMHKGMQAIREGFGSSKFITTFTPLLVTGLYCNAMRIGDDCAPIWRKDPDRWPWGCVEAMTNAARRYYFAPYVWATDPDCAYFGRADTAARWDVSDKPALTWNQSVTWLTAAALTGGVIKVGDWLPDLSEKEVAVMQRLLPTLPRPARPIDLFERDTPCIWSLPIKCDIGQWQIVGVFNWDETASQKIPISFEQLGLDATAYYTVYDFWQDTFHGLAQGKLSVDTAPGSCHLLGLRRYEDRPMFLATDRHFSQGATDFRALTWNPQTLQLAGAFDGIGETDYNLRILVPESYHMKSVTVSTGTPTTQQEGKVLKIAFRCATQGSVNWNVQF